MNIYEHISIITRRENRLDQAYWMEVELIDELHREATPQHEMELHYARAERLYELVERCVVRRVAISNRHVCVCDGGGFRDPCQWSDNEPWGELIEPTVVHLESVYDKWAAPSPLAEQLDRLYPIYEPLNDDEPF